MKKTTNKLYNKSTDAISIDSGTIKVENVATKKNKEYLW